ncbi:T9SS type A sorting domain-containing protein, partial [bacterium]|nr:T9SS type A sorting domain-containing protein [bacterium]
VVDYRLYANWPNPFNPNTTIVYDLKESGPVQLRIFDVLGREAAVLIDGYQEIGQHKVTFDASSLPSGIYFYRIKAGDFTDTKKMIFMK